MTVQTNMLGFEVGAGDKVHEIAGRKFCVKIKDMGAMAGCIVFLLEQKNSAWESVGFVDQGLDSHTTMYGGSVVDYIRQYICPRLQTLLNTLFGTSPPNAAGFFAFADVDAEIQNLTITGNPPVVKYL